MFVRYVDKKIHTIKESQIVFQLNTSLNHFKEQFELSTIHKGLIQKNSKFFVLNLDVVGCHVHIFVVCLTNIIKFRTIKKKIPYFFLVGEVRKIRRGFTTLHIDDRTYLFSLMLRRLGIEPSLILAYETSGIPYPPPAIVNKEIFPTKKSHKLLLSRTLICGTNVSQT